MIDFAIECKRKKPKERESKNRSLGAEVHFRILCSIANPKSDVPIECIQCLWKRIHLLTALFRIMRTLKSKISTNSYVFRCRQSNFRQFPNSDGLRRSLSNTRHVVSAAWWIFCNHNLLLTIFRRITKKSPLILICLTQRRLKLLTVKRTS